VTQVNSQSGPKEGFNSIFDVHFKPSANMSLIRIVKMTFKPEHVETFRHIFEERKERIASFPGCSSLELLHEDNIYFTYSKWDDAEALEKYRQSELFQSTWDLVKKLFGDKPEAWSVRKVD
jgi:hypothetical protein